MNGDGGTGVYFVERDRNSVRMTLATAAAGDCVGAREAVAALLRGESVYIAESDMHVVRVAVVQGLRQQP